MHRRARHLKGRAAGASFHYDSRWLSLSDGTGVDTWTDLAGTNNATQSTSTNRPTFKTNILNGNPVVRFDGTDDFVSFTTGAYVNLEYLAITLFKSSATIGPTVVNKTTTSGLPYTNFYYQGSLFSSTNGYAFVNNSFDMTSFAIASSHNVSSSSYNMWRNGDVKTPSSAGTNTSPTVVDSIGIRDWDNTKLNGDVAAAIHITGSLATSLRKRFEHAIGFSFKISCS